MLAGNLKRTGRFNAQPVGGPVSLDPTNVNYLRKALSTESRLPHPIRPRGAGAASTDCNRTEAGTTLNMTGLDRIVNVDNYNHTVTVQAGAGEGSGFTDEAYHAVGAEILPSAADVWG